MTKTKGKTGLKGIFSGTVIACTCPECNGIKVYSPNEFEIHADSRNKRPADYIYLENGINLRDVLNACTNAPLDALKSIIQGMIDCTSSSGEHAFCPNCKSRGQDFSTSEFGSQTIMICEQCEKEYHVSCLKEHIMDDLKELPEGMWFCCIHCSRIHLALEDGLVVGDNFLPEGVLKYVKSAGVYSWRLLSGRSADKTDQESDMLSKALSIFHARFSVMADSNSDLGDLLSHLVFGRTVRDQDFRGMYCAVLKLKKTIVCAGIVRVFGEEMAEIPLVAGRKEHIQVLFSCLESLLRNLNVKKLVLQAAEEESFWIKNFKFKKILKEPENYQKNYQMVVFQTTVLQKTLMRSMVAFVCVGC